MRIFNFCTLGTNGLIRIQRPSWASVCVCLSTCMGVVVLLQKLEVVEPLGTVLTPVLVLPRVLALVVGERLARGEALAALVADEALLPGVGALVHLDQVPG